MLGADDEDDGAHVLHFMVCGASGSVWRRRNGRVMKTARSQEAVVRPNRRCPAGS